MLALPIVNAEIRRSFVQSRSAFLEGSWDIANELKLIVGARFNDDRDSELQPTKCAGLGAFAVNAINPPDGKGACDGLFTRTNNNAATASDPNAGPGGNQDIDGPAGLTSLYPIGASNIQLPVTTRPPTFITGKKNNITDLWTGRISVNWSPKLDFTDQTFVYLTASRGELAGGFN